MIAWAIAQKDLHIVILKHQAFPVYQKWISSSKPNKLTAVELPFNRSSAPKQAMWKTTLNNELNSIIELNRLVS